MFSTKVMLPALLKLRAPPLSPIAVLMVKFVPAPPMVALPVKLRLTLLATDELAPEPLKAPAPALPLPLRLTLSLLLSAKPFKSSVPPLAVVAPATVPRLALVLMLSVPPLMVVAPT